MKLSKELAKRAKAKGICAPWHAQLLKLEDVDDMLEMYLKGIDFCLVNDYPSNDFIRANFKGSMERKGIFLDDTINVTNMPKVVCLGTTTGRIESNGYEVCEVFAKHDAALNVVVKDNAFVMIDVFDDAVVNVHASDRAKVCVNHYGGDIKHIATDDAVVKIREKNKKTY